MNKIKNFLLLTTSLSTAFLSCGLQFSKTHSESDKSSFMLNKEKSNVRDSSIPVLNNISLNLYKRSSNYQRFFYFTKYTDWEILAFSSDLKNILASEAFFSFSFDAKYWVRNGTINGNINSFEGATKDYLQFDKILLKDFHYTYSGKLDTQTMDIKFLFKVFNNFIMLKVFFSCLCVDPSQTSFYAACSANININNNNNFIRFYNK